MVANEIARGRRFCATTSTASSAIGWLAKGVVERSRCTVITLRTRLHRLGLGLRSRRRCRGPLFRTSQGPDSERNRIEDPTLVATVLTSARCRPRVTQSERAGNEAPTVHLLDELTKRYKSLRVSDRVERRDCMFAYHSMLRSAGHVEICGLRIPFASFSAPS